MLQRVGIGVGVGAGVEVTVIVTLCGDVVPPAPVHVRVYVVFAVCDTDCVLDVAFVPVHPPDAVQDVALVEDQVRVEDWPEVIEVGFEVKVRVGGNTEADFRYKTALPLKGGVKLRLPSTTVRFPVPETLPVVGLNHSKL